MIYQCDHFSYPLSSMSHTKACTGPPIQVSAHVAQVVALRAYQGGYATALPKPHNLLDKARLHMYNPQYKTYR